MSLINDALKRARQQAPEEPSPSAAEDPAMTPVTHSSRAPQWPLVVVPALLVGVIGVAAWFFWAASNSIGLTARTLSGTAVAAREDRPALPSDSTNRSNASAATASAAAPSATTNSPAATAAATPAPPPKPVPPTLKLQAIFYRPAHPTAIISSKAVSRGDNVYGARVLRIDRESVVLWVNGQTNVLTLP